MSLEYSPETLVSEFKDMSDKGDWFIYEDSRSPINQDYVDRKDIDGLVSFYSKALDLALSDLELIRLNELQKDLDALKPMIRQLVLETTANASSMDNVVSLYFEYGDTEASIFMCSVFDEHDDDWACSVVEESEEILLGNLGQVYDWEFETYKEELVRRYIDASLLSYFLEPIFKLDKLPFKYGFAEHDFKIIKVH